MKRFSLITTLLLVFGVTTAMISSAAERGGGHPGGPPKGGAPHQGGPSPGRGPTPPKSGGGMGGGISPNQANKEKMPSGANKEHAQGGANASTGPFGSGGNKGGNGNANAAAAERARNNGAGNNQAGNVARPGATAAAAKNREGGSENGNNVRPGAAAAAVGANNNNNSGVRPGAAAAVANNRNPANEAQDRPGGYGAAYAAGYGRGTTNEAVNASRYGTYYRSEAMLADQTMAVRAASVNYATYNAAMYSRYATAWSPVNLTNSSLYSHPGYGALSTGLKLDNTQPMAYDYGANVVMQNDAVYVNGSPAGTPQEYAAQATQLATTGREAQPADTSKWLPLGVFALVEGDATNSNDVFQLAVNPQGVIRGNYHNLANDQVENVVGSVDKETQRVAWTIGSDESPVYEAGVSNLTKDATPVLIHVGDGQTRQLTFIRLEESAGK